MDDKVDVIEMTAEIVAAYVENNTISTTDLPGLIQSVHRALSGISTGAETVEVAPKEPAVPSSSLDHPGSPGLFGRRPQVQVTQAAPAHQVQHEP